MLLGMQHLLTQDETLSFQPLDRSRHQLADQEVRLHRPPLPHHRNPDGSHTITADPMPADLRDALDHVHGLSGAH